VHELRARLGRLQVPVTDLAPLGDVLGDRRPELHRTVDCGLQLVVVDPLGLLSEQLVVRS